MKTFTKQFIINYSEKMIKENNHTFMLSHLWQRVTEYVIREKFF